jgi:signal transduction histidine kinase
MRWLDARPRSLRSRLLLATWAALSAALVVTGLALTHYFKQQVQEQAINELSHDLDQITALLNIDPAAPVSLDTSRLIDPRWVRPYSGIYWQVDSPEQVGFLRSRSLWDFTLAPARDALDSGVIHSHQITGPNGQDVLVVERGIRPEHTPHAVWRVLVAGDTSAMASAVRNFNRFTLAALLVLAALLAAAAWGQVHIGLAPLQALQSALTRLRSGQASDLGSGFPSEVQPLVDDFNLVLQRQRDMIERARQQAGNLAHGIKTPLAVIRSAAQATPTPANLATIATEQVDAAMRQVDWQLARARASAVHAQQHASANVANVIEQIAHTMAMVYQERGLRINTDWDDDDLCFAGQAQDLQEMLGNLVDNACKWAKGRVSIESHRLPEQQLRITVTDDGPGLTASQQDAVGQRGTRMDENIPGTGLGLAISTDLAQVYGGHLALKPSPHGGLQTCLTLPASAA